MDPKTDRKVYAARLRVRMLLAMGLTPMGIVAACHRAPSPEATSPNDASTSKTVVPATVASVVPDVVGTLDATAPSVDAPRVDVPPVDAGRAVDGRRRVDAGRPSPQVRRETIRLGDAGPLAWSVVIVPPASDRAAAMPRATCPSGTYCVHAPASVRQPAPAPFGTCEQSGPPGLRGGPEERFDDSVTKLEREVTADACCYNWWSPCPGGRPLRAEGRVWVASAVVREDWRAQKLRLGEQADMRAAEHWLHEAAAEHASVASFNRFSLQLLALGAPLNLVQQAQKAALDEVRHAEMCYRVASAFAKQAFGPGPLSLPSSALSLSPSEVALETLLDGCCGESIAAQVALESSTYARSELAPLLAQIAADEEAHAAFAFQSVAWMLKTFGAPVHAAIRTTIDSIHRDLGVQPETREPMSAAMHNGMLTPQHKERIRIEILRNVVVPCLHALLESVASPHEHTAAHA